jgi:NADH-quinone oxidoreductase subunit A
MSPTYIVLFLLGAFAISFPVLCFFALNRLDGGSAGAPERVQQSETGTAAEAPMVTRPRYSSRFFLVAVVFLVFSTAFVFLVPWVIGFRVWLDAHLAVSILAAVFIFVGILTMGYAWFYKKGALDWV